MAQHFQFSCYDNAFACAASVEKQFSRTTYPVHCPQAQWERTEQSDSRCLAETRLRSQCEERTREGPLASLSQQPNGSVLGAQQQQPLGGQHRQAGQRAAEVLRAQFCAADGALGDVRHGVNPDLVGHRPRHDLRAVQVEGVDGFRLGPVLAQRLGLQVLPHSEGVVSGGADDQVAFCSLKCTFQGTVQ